ncbi:MAG: hypothetical protein V1754_11565 [Pseudomonadota bacterium]
MAGDQKDKCGVNGEVCVACGSSQDCVAGKCSCKENGSCTGCCDGDSCKAGSSDTVCGTTGGICTDCTSQSAYCLSGVCTKDCSVLSCKDGCCVGKACEKLGAANANNCGVGGVTCQNCGTGETCENGTCNNSTVCNSTSCTGYKCCSKGTCQQGYLDSSCGENGEVCRACAAYQRCFDYDCVPKDSSLWDVIVSRVVLDSGTAWDGWPQSPPPDVFVEVTIGSQTKKTSTKSDTYIPIFDEYLMTVSFKDLYNKIDFVIKDQDLLWSTQVIADCYENPLVSEIEQGWSEIYQCFGDPQNQHLMSIKFDYKLNSQ